MGIHPSRLEKLFRLVENDRTNYFSDRLEHGHNKNENNPREAWLEPNQSPRPRSCWNERPKIDGDVFQQFTPMDNSDGKY